MDVVIRNLIDILKDAIAKITAWIERFKALTGEGNSATSSEV